MKIEESSTLLTAPASTVQHKLHSQNSFPKPFPGLGPLLDLPSVDPKTPYFFAQEACKHGLSVGQPNSDLSLEEGSFRAFDSTLGNGLGEAGVVLLLTRGLFRCLGLLIQNFELFGGSLHRAYEVWYPHKAFSPRE